MKKWASLKFKLILTTTLLFSPWLQAEEDKEAAPQDHYETTYNEYINDGFTDEELVYLYHILLEMEKSPHHQKGAPMDGLDDFLEAIAFPHIPTDAHTGEKFFETLAWYTDVTQGKQRWVSWSSKSWMWPTQRQNSPTSKTLSIMKNQVVFTPGR